MFKHVALIAALAIAPVAHAKNNKPAPQSNAVAVSGAISGSKSQAAALSSSSSKSAALSGSNSSARQSLQGNSGASANVAVNQPRSAPALGSLALGGGHPCQFSPLTAQFSVVGGGFGAGGGQIDEACMLAILHATTGDERYEKATLHMIAARDKEACKALDAAGLVECGTQASEPVPEVGRRAFAKCDLVNNRITFRKAAGATSEQARAECLAFLGY